MYSVHINQAEQFQLIRDNPGTAFERIDNTNILNINKVHSPRNADKNVQVSVTVTLSPKQIIQLLSWNEKKYAYIMQQNDSDNGIGYTIKQADTEEKIDDNDLALIKCDYNQIVDFMKKGHACSIVTTPDEAMHNSNTLLNSSTAKAAAQILGAKKPGDKPLKHLSNAATKTASKLTTDASDNSYATITASPVVTNENAYKIVHKKQVAKKKHKESPSVNATYTGHVYCIHFALDVCNNKCCKWSHELRFDDNDNFIPADWYPAVHDDAFYQCKRQSQYAFKFDNKGYVTIAYDNLYNLMYSKDEFIRKINNDSLSIFAMI